MTCSIAFGMNADGGCWFHIMRQVLLTREDDKNKQNQYEYFVRIKEACNIHLATAM